MISAIGYVPDADPNRYYAYFDSKRSAYYFFNPIQNKTVWDRPTDAPVFCGDTLLPFSNYKDRYRTSPKQNNELAHPVKIRAKTTRSSRLRKVSSAAESLHHIDLNDFRASLSDSINETVSSKASSHTQKSEIMETSIWDAEFERDQKVFELMKFAKEHFSYKTTGGFGRKVRIPVEKMLAYEETLDSIPLLASSCSSSKLSRCATQCFRYILSFVVHQDAVRVADFINPILKTPAIIDEAYLQLVKMSRDNRNSECLSRLWCLILAMTTFFQPSNALAPIIRSFLAAEASSTNINNRTRIAQLSYIRLRARIAAGCHLDAQPVRFVEMIPMHMEKCSYVFGASITELMWRRSDTSLPVPEFLHQLCEKILLLGALQTYRPFDAPVPEDVDKIVVEINSGSGTIVDVNNITTLIYLLMRFVEMIPGGLMKQADVIKSATLWVDTLSDITKYTVMYLVGFLRQFIHCADTGVDAENAANAWAPLMIHLRGVTQSCEAEIIRSVKTVMMDLLKSLNVSPIYPISTAYYNFMSTDHKRRRKRMCSNGI